MTSYLRRTAERAGDRGDIGGLIVTGLAGMNILQNYVDRTGDIQTAAILSSYVCPARFSDVRVDRWLEAYRDLLDGFKLSTTASPSTSTEVKKLYIMVMLPLSNGLLGKSSLDAITAARQLVSQVFRKLGYVY